MTGLAVVPALPYLFDHPVEQATEHIFDWVRERLSNALPPKSEPDKKEL